MPPVMPTMAETLGQFTGVVESIITMATSIVTFVVGTPLLLIPIAVGFLAIGVGLIKKFT